MPEKELVHEVAEKSDTLYWHGVIHGDTDAWVRWMTSDIYNSERLSLANEHLFKFRISAENSEVDVDSTSEFHISLV
jgi:hypothetical protein